MILLCCPSDNDGDGRGRCEREGSFFFLFLSPQFSRPSIRPYVGWN